MNVQFTASVEKLLDKIEEGDIKWKQVLKDFWKGFEVTLEKALINLTGILSSSMTYGQEKIEIQPKLLKNTKKTINKFKKDFSWEREVTEYIDCVKYNKKIYNGTIYDAIEVMKMIDLVYKSDKEWKRKFFNN